MIRVGITGQAGFIGQHLYNFLGTKTEQVSRSDFERSMFDNPEALAAWVANCDVIVHIAAMNRHEDPQVIYDTNVGLVQKLIDACKSAAVNPKIIFSSSTQEQQDNLANFTNAEPDDDQRDQRQRRDWTHEFDNRIKPSARPSGQPHGIPDWNTDQRSEKKTQQNALQ